MRPQKVLDIDMLIGLASVFRAKGYEGASLKDLADITGLKKASLYHRFPNGKQEMAEAVLAHIDQWVKDNIVSVLKDDNYSPKIRLQQALSQIRVFYNQGEETCIIRAFSMQAGLELFEQHVKEGLTEWLNAFTEIGIQLNLSPAVAEKKALQTLIDIQGSLILTKGLQDTSIFESTMQNIENNYLNT